MLTDGTPAAFRLHYPNYRMMWSSQLWFVLIMSLFIGIESLGGRGEPQVLET